MPAPGSVRLRRRAGLAALGVTALLASGCSGSPPTAAGTFAGASTRVLALVNATGAAIGAPARFVPLHEADPLPCKKKLLGYTLGDTGTNQAEVISEVHLAGSADGASLLPRIERYWTSRGYTLDRSGLSDHRFPKVRAHVGADLLVATGDVGLPQVNLYGVSACVK